MHSSNLRTTRRNVTRPERELVRGLAFVVPASLLGWALVLLPLALPLP
jgi:hypothetical protein